MEGGVREWERAGTEGTRHATPRVAIALQKKIRTDARPRIQPFPTMSKKIAIISTSCPLLEGKAEKLETGSWLEEIATPYYAFKAAKHEVSIVSIAGGVVPVDGGSTQGDFYTDDCKQFTADAEAQALMKDSPSIDAFDFGKVDAICEFFVESSRRCSSR